MSIFDKIFGRAPEVKTEEQEVTNTKESNEGFDVQSFNQKFVEANKALATGNTEGLKAGIGFLIESLSVSGLFASETKKAIEALYGALSHHDRADKKGPWNRDLSGYGLSSWKNDLYDRDDALRQAWPHIESINNKLKEEGLGWDY